MALGLDKNKWIEGIRRDYQRVVNAGRQSSVDTTLEPEVDIPLVNLGEIVEESEPIWTPPPSQPQQAQTPQPTTTLPVRPVRTTASNQVVGDLSNVSGQKHLYPAKAVAERLEVPGQWLNSRVKSGVIKGFQGQKKGHIYIYADEVATLMRMKKEGTLHTLPATPGGPTGRRIGIVTKTTTHTWGGARHALPEEIIYAVWDDLYADYPRSINNSEFERIGKNHGIGGTSVRKIATRHGRFGEVIATGFESGRVKPFPEVRGLTQKTFPTNSATERSTPVEPTPVTTVTPVTSEVVTPVTTAVNTQETASTPTTLTTVTTPSTDTNTITSDRNPNPVVNAARDYRDSVTTYETLRWSIAEYPMLPSDASTVAEAHHQVLKAYQVLDTALKDYDKPLVSEG